MTVRTGGVAAGAGADRRFRRAAGGAASPGEARGVGSAGSMGDAGGGKAWR